MGTSREGLYLHTLLTSYKDVVKATCPLFRPTDDGKIVRASNNQPMTVCTICCSKHHTNVLPYQINYQKSKLSKAAHISKHLLAMDSLETSKAKGRLSVLAPGA